MERLTGDSVNGHAKAVMITCHDTALILTSNKITSSEQLGSI